MHQPPETNPRAERLERLERSLFFIIGCGRSGTTLLQAILLRHPDVAIPPETKFLAKYGARLNNGQGLVRDGAFHRALKSVVADQHRKGVAFDEVAFNEYAEIAPRSWEGILLALLAAVADRAGTPRVGEKSPTHTPHLRRLAGAFPHAKFVHILRDPRAVVLSRINARFTSGMIGTEVIRWREAAVAHLSGAKDLGPSHYLAVRYEDLVNNPAACVRTICAFLDLQPRAEMLTPHARGQSGFPRQSTEWMGNTLLPIFIDSIDRWRTRLTRPQIAMIEHALRDEMLALGYEPTGASTRFVRAQLTASRLAGESIYLQRKCVRGVRRALRLGSPPPRLIINE